MNIIRISLISGCLFLSAQARAESVLAISWTPAFCTSHRNNAECQKPTTGRYDSNNFSLHGLWPDPASYCQVPSKQIADDQRSAWEKLPPVTLTADTHAKLKKVMPGTLSYLDRHEWTKHGTCSKLPPERYFAKAIAHVEQINSSSFVKLIRSRIGNTISLYAAKQELAKAFGTNAANNAKWSCRDKRLIEIQLRLNDDNPPLKPTSFSRGKGSSNCPPTILIQKP